MFWNLRNKLLLPTLTMVFLGFLGLSLFSYLTAKNNIQATIINDARGLSRGLGDTIELILSASKMDVSTMSTRASVLALLGKDDQESIPVIEAQMKDAIAIQPFYSSMTVLDKNGIIVASSSGTRGGKRGDRDYFTMAQAGKFAVSQPSTSKSTKASIIIFASPVYGEGQNFLGVSTAVMNLKSFSKRYIEHVKLGDEGFAMIVDASGKIVAHKNPEAIAQSIPEELLKRLSVMTQDNEYFTITLGGEVTRCFVQKEKNSGWAGIVLVTEKDLFQEVRAMAVVSLILALICIILTGFVTFFVIRGVTSDLGKGVAFASAVANGDLNQNLSIKRHDELGVLSNALTVMVENLKRMIATSDQKSTEALMQSNKAAEAMHEAENARKDAEQAKRAGLRQAAEQLGSIATSLTQAADTLLEQVSHAATGSETQRHRADEAASAVIKMASTVTDVAHSAGTAANSAIQTKEKAESGSKIMSDVLKAVTDVDKKTSELKIHMHELGETANSISQIMNVISDIADQTNLLALNAAIEAARAGEAGRGFAVVADEVRKLAEKTMSATGEVGAAVTAIQRGAETNIKGMDEASASVSHSTSLVHEADAALHEILAIAETTATKVNSIAEASEEQSAASREISDHTDSINSIAHENSDLMRQARSAVDSLMSLTNKINSLVADLKKA